MLLYRTAKTGWVLKSKTNNYVQVPEADWHGITTRDDLHDFLEGIAKIGVYAPEPTDLVAPMESQEVWAAGVTYYRSRIARMEESQDAGGGDFYDRVYSATRPELFMKGTAHRVAAPGTPVRIRRDSQWNVPEPELTLLISPHGNILGYTVGNDMSSRDIEGENPLYLPQAKVYDRSAAIGPAILVCREMPPPSTAIKLKITRAGKILFDDATSLKELKRTPKELVSYLYREASFPQGALLMTGTGLVPGDGFTLLPGDRVDITIDGIGTLSNTVEQL
jgi:2-dehydro-3-deoxy-D-arabinonate dehydratase